MVLFTAQNFILAGVGLHLVAALVKAVVKAPKQKAQVDAIEAKADLILNQVSQVLPAVQSASVGTNLDSSRNAARAAAGASDLSLSLAALPLPAVPASPVLTSVQGGAP